MSSGIRAVLLCAGEGRRLRPLTSIVPKPLLPVAGRTVAERTLDELRAIDCDAVALNLHHLGDRIRERFDAAYEGMALVYSEEPELLGTLGALGPLRGFLEPAELILVINGDSLCRWPLTRLVRAHRKRGNDATLLAARRADPSRFGGGMLVGREGDVLAFRGGREPAKGERRQVYAGAQVFSPALLERATATWGEPADFVSDLWEPVREGGGRVGVFTTRRRWHDLGTPRRYLEGALDFARGAGAARLWRRRWLAGGAEPGEGSTVRASVMESGSRTGRSRVRESLLFGDTVVGAGCDVRQAILGPGARLPDGTALTGRMVTSARSDVPVLEGDSVVGGMVYSRLEAATRGDRRSEER